MPDPSVAPVGEASLVAVITLAPQVHLPKYDSLRAS